MVSDGSAALMLAAWAICIFVATALCLRWLTPVLARRGVVDVPNERSSHQLPTPRGGGLAPALTLAVAGVAAGLWTGWGAWAVFGLIAGVLSVAFFADDRRSLPVMARLALQGGVVLAALAVVVSGWPAILPGFWPRWLLWPGLWLGWMWFINLYNFMDGIDGISGVETISIGAGAALTAALAGGPLAWQVMAGGLALAAAGAGFLTMNWHPARVFLGDAGSIPLGFLGGGLLIALAAGGQPAAALILPAYYLVDATVTLVRRLLRGEKVWLPHKSHAYQAAHQAGLAHDAICRRIMLCNVLLAVLAVLSIWQPLAALAAAYFAAFAVYGWLLRGNVG